jgi:hypothetical protein
MGTPPSDLSKDLWKRGDVCTQDFKTFGWVLCYTPHCLAVRWASGTVETFSAGAMDGVLRVGHANSIGPAGGHETNLELLEVFEALDRVETASRNRKPKNDREQRELDNLIRRHFYAKDGCNWDKRHSASLYSLALWPETVSVIFKLRERLHRLLCKRSRPQ